MKPLNIFGRLLIFSIVFLIVQILPAPSGDIGFMSAQAQVKVYKAPAPARVYKAPAPSVKTVPKVQSAPKSTAPLSRSQQIKIDAGKQLDKTGNWDAFGKKVDQYKNQRLQELKVQPVPKATVPAAPSPSLPTPSTKTVLPAPNILPSVVPGVPLTIPQQTPSAPTPAPGTTGAASTPAASPVAPGVAVTPQTVAPSPAPLQPASVPKWSEPAAGTAPVASAASPTPAGVRQEELIKAGAVSPVAVPPSTPPTVVPSSSPVWTTKTEPSAPSVYSPPPTKISVPSPATVGQPAVISAVPVITAVPVTTPVWTTETKPPVSSAAGDTRKDDASKTPPKTSVKDAKPRSVQKEPVQIVDEIRTYDNYMIKSLQDGQLGSMYADILNTEQSIQDYLNNMILSEMKNNLSRLIAANKTLETETVWRESVVESLAGYTPVGKDEPTPSDSLSSIINDQRGASTSGGWDKGTPTSRPVMTDTRAAQYETVTIDTKTGKFESNLCKAGSPTHGCLRTDGMVYSEDYGEYVSKGVFDFEKGLKDKWEQDQAKRDTEREKSWDQYYKEHGGPSLDDELKEKIRAVWEAEQSIKQSDEKIRLYDKVLPQIEKQVKALNERTKLLSPEQITTMSQSMIKAIANGASETDLKEIAKNYIKMGMDSVEAQAAGYEEDEAYAQLAIDVSHTIVNINSIVNPVSGTITEIGVAIYEGYEEGGIKSTLWTTAKYTLPVNAAEALYNGGSFKDVFFALIQDTGNIAQLKGALSAAKGQSGNVAGNLDDMDAGAPATRADRAASEWVENCVANPTACMEKSRIQTERSKAYIAGRVKAQETVNDFQTALKSGKADDIKDALARVQQDKHALQMINQTDDATKISFNKTIQDIYKKTDEKVIKRLSNNEEYVNYLKKKYGKDIEIKVGNVAPTNPSGTVKVSYDRDITYRTIIKDKAGNTIDVIDVPPKYSEQIYGEELYDAFGKPKIEGCISIQTCAKKFGQDMDQAVTDRFHAEAYGSGPDDLHVALNNPAGKFSNPEQIGQAMNYKANHWYEKASELAGKGDFAQAEAAIEEGMRQTTKQFSNQVIKRVEAANQALAKAGKPPISIPSNLQDAINVINRVGTGPGKGWTPAQAEQMLETIGWTPKQVGYEMGKYVESLQKLSPV